MLHITHAMSMIQLELPDLYCDFNPYIYSFYLSKFAVHFNSWN